MKKLLLLLFFASAFMSSCKLINQSNMLKTPRNFKYDDISAIDTASRQYVVAINDVIELRLFSNDGFRLIDLTNQSGEQSQMRLTRSLPFDVEFDGAVKFPVIGRKKITGMTVRDVELMLQDEYSKYYNKPFVLLNVSSKKVIVFPGNPGDAKVVQLSTDNTTLIEALARAGGISERGKARKIKVIRGEPSNRKIYKIDLSTIDGLKMGDMILQSNDIIYIEPRPYIARTIVSEIAPIVSLISTTLLLVTLLK